MVAFRIHHPNCDLCGGRDYQLIAKRDRRGAPLRTVICRTCGLIRHWRVPSEIELSQFYGTEYRQAYHGEYIPSNRRVMRAWRKAEKVYQGIAPCLDGVRRVFEIGAGIGCTVKYFQRHGFEASGVEPNDGFQKFAVNALRARVQQGTVQQCPPAAHDLVLLIHVIEHLRSPRQALGHIHQLLASGGLLYVECPDVGANFTRREKMFHFAHIHNFNRPTLSAMLESCGYRIVSWISPGNEPNLCLLASPLAISTEHASLTRCSPERVARMLDAAESGSIPGTSASNLLLRDRSPEDLSLADLSPVNRSSIIGGQGYQEALAALERFNTISYHLRREYLVTRARKVAAYAEERIGAHRFVANLVASCQDDPPLPTPPEIGIPVLGG